MVIKKGKVTGMNILVAVIGVFFVGCGIAFNDCTCLGNDQVGILYDGIRNVLGLSAEQLGMAANVVNVSLMVALFFIARRYVNIGTLVYLLPYGFCVSAGKFLYRTLVHTEGMPVRILFSVIGCLFIAFGVALYIVVDIGVDPFTGIVLWLCDLTHKEYWIMKILFDITIIIIGTLLGGKLGVVTVAVAIGMGPVMQFFVKMLENHIFVIEKGE